MRIVFTTTGAKVVTFLDTLSMTTLFLGKNRAVFDLCQQTLEVEDAFRPHVEQKVEDAEVGQEAVTLAEHLIVGTSLEVRVCWWLLGTDGIAIVCKVGSRLWHLLVFMPSASWPSVGASDMLCCQVPGYPVGYLCVFIIGYGIALSMEDLLRDIFEWQGKKGGLTV